MSNTKLAVFASGSGTNAENIADYFQNNPAINVSEILSNKKDAFVHKRAARLGIPSSSFTKEEFKSDIFVEKMQKYDYIILAGFLWLIPEQMIQSFPDRIINIHPALLPKYGGKGMYGDRVHQAVIDGDEKESGITIHLVNEEYDRGAILFQAKCQVDKDDNAESLADKVHRLEYAHFPKVIEEYILKHA